MRFIHTADWQLGMTRHFLDDDAQPRYSAARRDAVAGLGALAQQTGAEFVGKTLVFAITEYSEEGRNIVVSRRKLLEQEQALSADAFLKANLDGAVVSGTVVRLEKFGAFVELAPGVSEAGPRD